MAGCCAGTAGCRCVVSAADPGLCSPIEIEVTGAGSSAVPFAIGGTLNLDRVFQQNGYEPWKTAVVGGCEVVVPRCQFDAESFLLMTNVSKTLVGYALLGLNCETGSNVPLYQAVDSTATSTTLPSGWEPACTTSVAGQFAPMFTDAADETTRVGYVFIRHDPSTNTYQQRYITNAGTITNTKPVSWRVGACGAASSGGGGSVPSGGIAVHSNSVHLYLQSGLVLDDTKYPDWGQPGLSSTLRYDTLRLPPRYTTGLWKRMTVTVVNVSAALTEALTITLKDLTNAVDVGTITFATSTAPTANALTGTLTIASGSFADGVKLQWHVANVQSGNAFALHAEAFYEASPS